MLKKYINKQTLIAFSIGALLFSTTPIKAATDYVSAYFNSNQKVTVNGTEKQIQFLNASDTNYGKLRDIVKAMGGETSYNDATQTIEITTSAAAVTPAATPSPTPSTSATINKTESDNMSTTTVDTTVWIGVRDFSEKYHGTDSGTKFSQILLDNMNLLPKTSGKTATIQTDIGSFTFLNSNDKTYVKISDLKVTGLLN